MKKARKPGLVAIIVFAFVCCFCIIPILYTVSISFSDEATLAKEGYRLIPSKLSLDAYKYILKSPRQILRAYGVTIFVTVVGTALSLFCTCTFAYAAARKDFRLHGFFSGLLLFTLLFNIGLVGNYITVSKLYGLKDTVWALILPYVIMPWHVFLMKGFLNDMPLSLIESAKIDGCGEIGIFFKIILPISKPSLAAVGLLIAFTYWNDWWLGMLYIESPELAPLQLLLYRIMNSIQYMSSGAASATAGIDLSHLPSETARMAMFVLASWPMLFVYPFFQKYFVKGITLGAVKG